MTMTHLDRDCLVMVPLALCLNLNLMPVSRRWAFRGHRTSLSVPPLHVATLKESSFLPFLTKCFFKYPIEERRWGLAC